METLRKRLRRPGRSRSLGSPAFLSGRLGRSKKITGDHKETTFTRSGRSYLSQNATEFIVCTISKMAETNNEFNSSLFMEEVQLYECLYNKHCRDYKNKFIRINCWKKIAEKFNIDEAEAEKKFIHIPELSIQSSALAEHFSFL